MVILVVIQMCQIKEDNALDMHYYKKLGWTDVVDIRAVQCLVGRVRDHGWWVIIDRSGDLVRAEVVGG